MCLSHQLHFCIPVSPWAFCMKHNVFQKREAAWKPALAMTAARCMFRSMIHVLQIWELQKNSKTLQLFLLLKFAIINLRFCHLPS